MASQKSCAFSHMASLGWQAVSSWPEMQKRPLQDRMNMCRRCNSAFHTIHVGVSENRLNP